MSEINPLGNQESEIETLAASEGSVATRNPVVHIASKVWGNVHMWRVVALVTIVAIGLVFTSTRGPIALYKDSDPYVNPFVAPRDFEGIIERLDESVVSVYCDFKSSSSWFGTGWAFEFDGISDKGRSALITNHHVIEECIGKGKITLQTINGDVYPAKLEKYDENYDLAILSSSHIFQTLDLVEYPPYRGSWVMAYGSADEYMGSVAIGNLINFDEYGDILMSANISGGNSGGPLVDNEGNVFGVNTWSYNNEKENTQYNIAVSLDSFCAKLLDCDGDTYWDWD